MKIGELEASPSQRRNMWFIAIAGGLAGGVVMPVIIYFAWDLTGVKLDESQAPAKNLGEIIKLLARLASPLFAFVVGASFVHSYDTRLTEKHDVHILSLPTAKFDGVSAIVTTLTCAVLLGIAFALDFI